MEYIDLKVKTLREHLYYIVEHYSDKLAVAGLANGVEYTYRQFYDQIQRVKKVLLQDFGFKKGDKVAIWSENMPQWGVAYFAITTAGLVGVPLLPDFSSFEVQNILAHSEAKAIFVSKKQLYKFKDVKFDFDKVILIDDFTLFTDLKNFDTKKNRQLLSQPQSPSEEPPVYEDDLALIIYTSGTTGKSKGVMLTHKNIVSNVLDVQYVQMITSEERFLSILPLSHSYENTVGFLAPLLHGASIYYLSKPPTASYLLPAMQKVKPTLMLVVPLIVEKIYRKKILPEINANFFTRNLYKTPLGRKLINKKAGKKLHEIFGGKLKFFGVGGAKLDPEVERFMRDAHFPYAVGYGLTETGPLLAGANPQEIRFQSCGKPMRSVTLKLKDPDPVTGEGEVIAKGPNIMKGYYKEPELTKSVFTEDGWFRTGDLGVFDKDGFLYLKGRIKNVIIGPSGENIYPEEIEAIINSFEHVNESVVVERGGKLVALVHFDFEAIEKKAEEWFLAQKKKTTDFFKHLSHRKDKETEQVADDKVKENIVNEYMNYLINSLKQYVNSRVNKTSRIQDVVVQKEPFVKTATKKIKRFLYTERKNTKK